jgi:hypothetical protein
MTDVYNSIICTRCVDENIQPPMKAIVMYNGTGFCLTHYRVIKNKEESLFKIRSTQWCIVIERKRAYNENILERF